MFKSGSVSVLPHKLSRNFGFFKSEVVRGENLLNMSSKCFFENLVGNLEIICKRPPFQHLPYNTYVLYERPCKLFESNISTPTYSLIYLVLVSACYVWEAVCITPGIDAPMSMLTSQTATMNEIIFLSNRLQSNCINSLLNQIRFFSEKLKIQLL